MHHRKAIFTIFALAVTTASTLLLSAPVKSRLASDGTDYAPSLSLPYDAEVSYIEQNGAGNLGYPNLDTGFPMSDIRRLSLVCDWTNHSTVYRELIGGGLSGSYSFEISPDGYYGLGYNNYSSFLAEGVDQLDWVYTPGSKPQLFVNGVLGCTDNLLRVPTGTLQTSLSPHLSAHIKLYGLTIWSDGDDIALDLIPVRFTNDLGQPEGAMYDRISGVLITNSGSGSFIIGPDL